MTDQIAMDQVVNALDERLLNFAPPKIVTRTTRTLHERAGWFYSVYLVCKGF